MSAPGVGTLLRALAAPRSVADMLRAMLALRKAKMDLQHAPIGALLPLTAAESDGGVRHGTNLAGDPAVVASRRMVSRRWTAALKRAERYGPWQGACLVRSLALHRLLERGGVTDSVVRVGVRMAAAGGPSFEAHAWVEVDGVVVGDAASVQTKWTMLGTSTGVAAGERQSSDPRVHSTLQQLVQQETS